MMAKPESAVDPAAAVVARGARRLTRGITATWWYTLIAVLTFEAMLILIWVSTLLDAGLGPPVLATVGIGGLVWWASTVPLIVDYRHRTDASPLRRWKRMLLPLSIAVVYGVTAGITTGIWLIALLPIVQSLMLLNWPPGLRLRIAIAATVLLAALWFVDTRVTFAERMALSGDTEWGLPSIYTVLLPAITVLSLWWWDVLITLDRARASEARLAATQERLRVATDVHDLQGHHLQVIALQLELAERLMERDAPGAMEQLRAARLSVDGAQQGTRDLALRFRSVPLRDELANAVDLMRAAGTAAEATVTVEADHAPADVFGPVIRETTTNVLRHGGGRWARLSLQRVGSSWRYEIVNDVTAESVPSVTGAGNGSGLEGLERRAADAGGTLQIRRGRQEFGVTMTVPAPSEDAR